MANIHSQKKRNARTERERLENLRYTSKIKTYFKRLEKDIAEGDKDLAAADHRELISAIDKATKTGAIHANNGARKRSRADKLVASAS